MGRRRATTEEERIGREILNALEKDFEWICALGSDGRPVWNDTDGCMSFVMESNDGFHRITVAQVPDPAEEAPEHTSECTPICTVSRWGEDDYSCEWLMLPQNAADEVYRITEPFCGCSVRGKAKDIANEVKDMLKQSKAAN